MIIARRYLPKSNLVFKTNNNIITHHSFLPKQIIYKLQSSSYCTESNNKNKPTDINNNNIQQSNPPFVNPSNQPQQTNVNNNNNITKNETIKSEEINKSDNVVVEKDFSDSWKDFKRLMALARPETKNILLAVGCLLVSSSVTMSVPFSMGKIIDIVVNPASTPLFGLPLPSFFLLLGGVFTLGAAANFGRVVLFRITGERIVQKLRNKLFQSIIKQDISFFDLSRSGDLISRLSSDTSVIGKSLTQNISDGLRSLVMSVAGLTMMVYVHPSLTLTMLSIVPPIAFAAVIYGRFVRRLSKKTQTAIAEITKVAEERLGNIRTVHAFAKERAEVKEYESKVNDVFILARKEAYASGMFFGSAGLSGNLTILALLWYGGNMVHQGHITIGSLTSFMLLTAYLGSSLIGLTGFYSEAMKGIGASSRVFEILERQPQITANVGKILPSAHGKIEFKNVNFTYPTRPQTQIFHNVSFSVEPGTVIAICGPSGSGKSTIGSLLLRFYDPSSGQVTIDQTPVSELNLEWWRKQIGLVSQEPVLFAGTIAENIAYGNESATREQIEAAAIKANCAGFISGFEKGYDTFVGERGISLSGGQKQRIAIARALLKDPSILILDEATSALDAESEKLVQEALERLMAGRTVITIAHRISTIKTADCIVCLTDGSVAEIGPYDQLLQKKDGIFKRLVKNQLLH